MERIWKKIIRRRRFSLWTIPAFLLWLVSLVYRLIIRIRTKEITPEIKCSVPVISVGNITVGGTGKTPLVAMLADRLMKEGVRVGIVSIGYKRQSEESFIEEGYKVQQMATADTGDEVKHLAYLLPDAVFSVHEEKSIAAQLLDEQKLVDVIIVDDGFQHRKLHRDLDIVAYDAAIKKRYLKPFPYGLMREPHRALRRADIIILTRIKFAYDIFALQKKIKRYAPNAIHYNARFDANQIIGKDQIWPVKYLEDKSVFLFAGIGNFKMLKKQVFALCTDLDYAMELSDHQQYDQELLEHIKKKADEFDSDLILTTGKDWVKLENFDFGREIYYLDQNIDLDPGEEKLLNYIIDKFNLKQQAQ